MRGRARWVVTCIAVAAGALATSCANHAPPTATAPSTSTVQSAGASAIPVPVVPPPSGRGQGGGSGGGSGGSSGSGGGDVGATRATEDDQRVFGYATTDEAAVAAQTGEVADRVSQLATDAAARNVSAVQADAQALADSANSLDHVAHHAGKRQEPLDPVDHIIASARDDAIDAFGLTEDYAEAAVNLGDALTSSSVSELATAVNQVLELSGQADQLESSYDQLTQQLSSWASDHPVDAAMALQNYG